VARLLHVPEGVHWALSRIARLWRGGVLEVPSHFRPSIGEHGERRHTAQRIYERLRDEHGYFGSASSVRRYVASQKVGQGEVFVPLCFARWTNGSPSQDALTLPSLPQRPSWSQANPATRSRAFTLLSFNP
jgi:hypothetical protein